MVVVREYDIILLYSFHGTVVHGSIACSIPTAQTSLCLHHNVDSEDGSVEHEPPRRMDNEMTYEMVQEQEKMIRLLHFQQNDTKAIHRTVGRDGLILGPRRKQQVSGMAHSPAASLSVPESTHRAQQSCE